MNNKENSTSWTDKGNEYFYGKGVEEDHYMALQCYLKGAENGERFAQIKLGEMYCTSDSIEEDFEKAEYWFKKALSGYSLSTKYIAIGEQLSEKMYYIGKGEQGGYRHEWRPEKAIYWYKKASELGSGDAMFFLAKSYRDGYGIEKDETKSFFWFKEALENGCSNQISTLIFLANFYEEGLVCTQNIDKAIKLYNKALNKCNTEIDSYNGLPSFYVDHDHINNLHSRINEINEKKKKINTIQKKWFLFFDVETTGIPKNWNASISDSENWPRLVQIAWLLYDENGKLLDSKSEIIRPVNFIIPKIASDIHGITTEFAIQTGKNLNQVLENFKKVLEQSSLIIAHNVKFDKSVVGAEYYRLFKSNPLSSIKSFCTMEASKNICRIDGVYGYKYPKLQELYYFLFHQNFESAHDAMVDTKATAKCYFELKKKNLI